MPGAFKGFVENFLLLSDKELSMSYVDYHDDMSGIVFGDWFENMLTANLPKERKVVVVMDNAKYHCRFIEKASTMNMKKDEMIAFMSKHDIDIPNPIPTKSVLLEKILIIFENIEKQYVIDSLVEKAGYSVLRFASVSLHIESHINGMESIKISRSSLECLYK